MIKVDIFSGFLGAGKTTLIKKLVEEAYRDEKIVLIENEFGEIGVDSGFLKDAGIEINEMNSGCICCSLVGDFGKSLQQVIEQYSPDRILIEPSGVGKLSDIVEAVENLNIHDVKINGLTTVADVKKAKLYMKNFGEFYNNQIQNAETIILSHTKDVDDDKMEATVGLIRDLNPEALIVTTDWNELSGEQLLSAIEKKDTIDEELKQLEEEEHHHHHGHHHKHGSCCGHGHGKHEHHHEHHHEHEHEHEHGHDHEDNDEHEHEHGSCCGHGKHKHKNKDCSGHGKHEHRHHHHHEHEHDNESCGCGHDHEEHHHHHHHADEVFDSIGLETTNKFTEAGIREALEDLENEKRYGFVLRAKGIVEKQGGGWIHFDYVPGEPDVREGAAEVTGRICVIGTDINVEEIRKIFDI
jgi:G3E family GTPase